MTRLAVACLVVASLLAPRVLALPSVPGDLDEDASVTMVDAVRLVREFTRVERLPPSLVPFADLDQDAVPSHLDLVPMMDILLERGTARATRLSTSPDPGEGDVALTRETILRFLRPLRSDVVPGPEHVTATFGGESLAFRLHLSPDRHALTLFYASPLPASSRVRVTVDGTALLDPFGEALDADGDGAPGGVGFVDFDTVSLTGVSGTRVCGTVYASELAEAPGGEPVDAPLAGVTITVDGAEALLNAVTDELGNFCLEDAPAGTFFVHVDGRTATNPTEPGDYYPFVGKAWTSIPLAQVDVGSIYLPLVRAGTLQPVSQDEPTTLHFAPSVLADFPSFADVSITVPADSLFADDGTRGGMVGIAPVPPSRLPGQLPPELAFPVIITVQTDGATNFDVPVPACFPNLPDPATGYVRLAGSKSALWSFNHDTGRFEVVGSMTVDATGALTCTDPGVGILAPGWHGTQPGADGEDGDADEPSGEGGGSDCSDDDCPLSDSCIRTGGICTEDDSCGCPDPANCDLLVPYLSTLECCDATTGIVVSDRCHIQDIAACPNRVTRPSWNPYLTANGCGAAGAAGAFVPESPNGYNTPTLVNSHGVVFTPACNNHDACWGACSRDPGHKAGCDSAFLDDLVDLCLAQLPPASDELEDCIAAARWYYSVVIFDYLFYSVYLDAQIEGCICCEDVDNACDGVSPAIAAGTDEVTTLQAMVGLDATGASVARRPSRGRHHFALQDWGRDVVVQRGLAGSNGQRHESLVVQPSTLYREHLLRADTLDVGHADFTSPPSGASFRLPRIVLRQDTSPDEDVDGLRAAGEYIMGTNPANPDSDGDGVLDGAEVQQGTDPLDNLPARTGIVKSLDTPGEALDVCVFDNLAAIADGSAGVTLVNAFSGTQPVAVARVQTPGTATTVACAGEGRVVAADSVAGLVVIDVSDLTASSIERVVEFESPVRAVVAAAGTAHVGLASGEVLAVDLGTGAVTARRSVGGEVEDLALVGDRLLVLTETELVSLVPTHPSLDVAGRTSAPGVKSCGRRRLFAGGGVAYVTSLDGFDTYALGSGSPTILADGSATDRGWCQIVPDGSGGALAATAPASTDPRDVSLYDVSSPFITDAVQAVFPTPGNARSLAFWNGLGYVADGAAGLQVVNPKPFDTAGVPPVVQLDTSATSPVEERHLVRFTATVSDDVQVRNVEFHVDGVRVAIDGSFPFELRMLAPEFARGTFAVRARASDTGGNATWSNEIAFTIGPDTTPPRLLLASPRDGALVPAADSVTARFDGPLDPATLSLATFALHGAGADRRAGTPDDVALAEGVSLAEDGLLAVLDPAAPLGPGLYRASLRPPLADAGGNALVLPVTWDFRVLDGPDADGDGLTDALEAQLGLHPEDTDSDDDGVPDSREDADADGLDNAREALLGTDPTNEDTDGDRIRDADEAAFRCDPFVAELSTLRGRVVDEAGLPRAGATVRLVPPRGASAATLADGTFEMAPAPGCGLVRVQATVVAGDAFLRGTSAAIEPVRGGTTQYGDIVVRPVPAAIFAGMTIPLDPRGAEQAAIGDVNEDGRPDVVVVDGPSQLQIVFGVIAGAPIEPPSIVATGGPEFVGAEDLALADVNADAHLDALLTWYGGNLGIATGNGDGTFDPIVVVGLPFSLPQSVGAADLDADGRVDLFATTGSQPIAAVSLQAEDGTFPPASMVFLDGAQRHAVLASLNGDGLMDFVGVGFSDGEWNLQSYLQGPAGSFTRLADVSLGNLNATGLALADLDEDGDLDALTSLQRTDSVVVMLNQGGGAFGAPVAHGVGDYPWGPTTGDFDGDGDLDVATPDSSYYFFSVLLGNGDGTFQPRFELPASGYPAWAGAADLSGDGALDLLGLNYTPDLIVHRGPLGPAREVDGYRWLEAFPRRPYQMAVGDFTGDGAADAVVAIGDDVVNLYAGGAGFFAAQPTEIPTIPDARLALAGDMDEDGDLDVVLASHDDSSLQVLLAAGGGAFVRGPALDVAVDASRSEIGDFDGDGRADVALLQGSRIQVAFGDGAGGFSATRIVELGDRAADVVAADLDLDGRDEMVVACTDDDRICIVLGDASRRLDQWWLLTGVLSPDAIGVGDMGGDGLPDVVVVPDDDDGSTMLVFRNLGGGAFARETGCVLGSHPNRLFVSDLDEDGIADVLAHASGIEAIALSRGGSGECSAPEHVLAPYDVADMHLVDLDADGDLDIAGLTEAGLLFAIEHR